MKHGTTVLVRVCAVRARIDDRAVRIADSGGALLVYFFIHHRVRIHSLFCYLPGRTTDGRGKTLRCGRAATSNCYPDQYLVLRGAVPTRALRQAYGAGTSGEFCVLLSHFRIKRAWILPLFHLFTHILYTNCGCAIPPCYRARILPRAHLIPISNASFSFPRAYVFLLHGQ